MGSKGFGAAALAGFLAIALGHGAAAQVTADQQAAIRSSCRSDFMSKCSGVTPGGKEALQCLQTNVASLSASCKTAVSATLPKPAPAAAATAPSAPPPPPPAPAPTPAPAPAATAPAPAPAAPSIQTAKPPAATMPSAAKPAAAAPAKPAAAPAAKPPTQAAMPPAPPDAAPAPTTAQMNAIKATCRGDFTRNCKGVPAGGPEAVACLRANAAKLSPNCRTSLADIADTAAPAAPTAPVTQRPNAPVVMTAVIGRACLRDLVRRCRDTGVGDGQKIACLQANEDKLAPLCKAALRGTAPIR